MVRSNCLLTLDLHTYVHANGSRHSRFISSLVCQKWEEDIKGSFYLMSNASQFSVTSSVSSDLPRLYQTSISPLRVRTSIMVWPKKSSLSRLNLCFTRDLMSSSSSHTRTLIRSDELWHSLDEAEFKQNKSSVLMTYLILNARKLYTILNIIRYYLEVISMALTSGSFLPRQGWDCHKWSSFSSSFYQLEQLHTGHWSQFCP